MVEQHNDKEVQYHPFFRNLILEGGSLRCCVHIGCLKYLEERRVLQNVKNYVGASSGSLIAFFACLGYSPEDMIECIKEYIQSQNDRMINIENMLNIFYSLGIDDGEHLESYLRSQLQKKLGADRITFLEFTKQTGKNIVIIATHLNDLSSKFFCVDSTPQVDIVDAIMASTAIPVIFIPRTIDNAQYIDGGFVNNFPFDYVNDSNVKDTLGIRFKLKAPDQLPPQTFITYIGKLCKNMIKRMNTVKGSPGANIKTIEVDITSISKDDMGLFFDLEEMKFVITEQELSDLIDAGYTTIKDSFRQW